MYSLVKLYLIECLLLCRGFKTYTPMFLLGWLGFTLLFAALLQLITYGN